MASVAELKKSSFAMIDKVENREIAHQQQNDNPQKGETRRQS